MANTQLSLIPQNFPVTVNMLVVLKGAEKMEAEMKGLRGKVAAFKKSMEDSGLEPLDVAGFIAEGGLLKPFQDGIKKAIEAQDALAKKVRANKGLKVPKVVHGETSANLEKFNKALDKVSLKIGQALLPAVNGIVTALTPMITSIGQFIASNPYLVEGLAAAAVAFTVVTVGAMGLVAVLGILTSPIGLIAAGIAAAVAVIVIGARLITKHWDSISGFFGGLWTSIKASFNSGIDKVKQNWRELRASTSKTLDEMGASVLKSWDDIRTGTLSRAADLAAGASEKLEKFSAASRQIYDSASDSALKFWDDSVQAAWAGCAAVKTAWDDLALRDKMSAGLEAAGELFFGFWDSAAQASSKGLAAVEAAFDSISIKDTLANALQSTRGLLADSISAMSASASGQWEQFKSIFSWSPTAMFQEKWQPLGQVFSSLWDVLRAGAEPFKVEFQSLFDGSPVDSAMARWDGLKGYFSGLWATLSTDSKGVKTEFDNLFSQSPLESLQQAWEPVVSRFSEIWARLKSFVEPISALFSGNLSELVATITGQSGADGQGAQPTALFGGGATGMSSTLPQSSSALIQQSAANSRTQLEGGLTVRFENAPAGLRTDQPQTNQPGLALSSRIGYRSLSAGGSNELA